MNTLEAFHLLRPWALLVLPVLAVLWWRIRPKRTASPAALSGLAPHLANALTVGGADRRRLYPVDGVMAVLALLTLAVAGPSWTRLPDPFQAETAPMVVALKVTPSMEEGDVAPSRLERATFKIRDLVNRRAGAETALIAYAGTAHRVVPLTTDPGILGSFLDGLSAKVMPVEGDAPAAALARAQAEMDRAETPGAILFILDDLSPQAVAELNTAERGPLVVYVVAPPDIALPQLDGIENARIVRMTPDDGDLDQIERHLTSAYQAALAEDDSQVWEDRGWWLAWPAALLLLMSFRRGWTMPWAAVAVVLFGLTAAPQARAEGLADLFWTPDQQGQRAYDANQFGAAAELFSDPMWRALSLFRAGQYEAAAEAYAALDGAEAAFGEGMARLRNRQYRPGVRAFERALELRPDYPEAERNLVVAQAIVAFVESTQAQSDTGEEAGIGADEVVMDNESGLGEQTQIMPDQDGLGLESAEQWMRTVDTNVGDFLATRFKLEAAAGDAE
ncbi:VWA domain-containing protein [Dinoroseobacter sp. S124A]|uniref:VWA domain-containing protein n=1 Tax=Dinoroseobacter sp. S124A TaxID=3415128 RepID=UPI003C7E39E4